MKTMLVVFLLVPSLSWAFCDDWDSRDTNIAIAFSGAVAADVYTTMRVLDAGGYEANPLIGKYPSDAELLAWGGVAIGAYLASACLIPKEWREHWGLFWIGAEAGRTVHGAWEYRFF